MAARGACAAAGDAARWIHGQGTLNNEEASQGSCIWKELREAGLRRRTERLRSSIVWATTTALGCGSRRRVYPAKPHIIVAVGDPVGVMAAKQAPTAMPIVCRWRAIRLAAGQVLVWRDLAASHRLSSSLADGRRQTGRISPRVHAPGLHGWRLARQSEDPDCARWAHISRGPCPRPSGPIWPRNPSEGTEIAPAIQKRARAPMTTYVL